MADLSEFTTEEMRLEVERREREAKEREKARRKAAEVRVYCPECDGAGKTQNFGLRVACGEESEWSTCSMCRGSRTIVARRAD